MKKMTLKKLFGGIFAMSMALFAVSCAQGFDDEETFSGGVTNSQSYLDAIANAAEFGNNGY